MTNLKDRFKHVKYYGTQKQMGGNYYKDSDHKEFDLEGSLCVEAEMMYLFHAPDRLREERETFKKSKAYPALQGDGAPIDLKASLYYIWNSAPRVEHTDEEFIKFYSKMYQ